MQNSEKLRVCLRFPMSGHPFSECPETTSCSLVNCQSNTTATSWGKGWCFVSRLSYDETFFFLIPSLLRLSLCGTLLLTANDEAL